MNGIYLHAPFCIRKCFYCDFYSVEANEPAMELYCGLPINELDLILQTFPSLAETCADTVYFGGGTPSILGLERLQRLLEGIRSRLSLAKNAEITLEANPGTLWEGYFHRLRESGFNRISLGVQSFNPSTLATLGRIHTDRQAQDAFRRAREARFSSVGIDLIFGNPGQKNADWAADLEEAVALFPDHISAYAFTPASGTPIHHAISRGEITLVSDDETAEMYDMAIEILSRAGYRHYEISNFAKPGHECRHNQKYWRRQGYLGLGPSAHGLLFPGEKAPLGMWTANPCSLEEYASLIKQGRLPWARSGARNPREAWEEFFVFGLRTADGVSLKEAETLYGPLPEKPQRAIDKLVDSGYLVRNRDHLRMPEKYWFVSNELLLRLV
ncbi:MAG: radical SAM family heme chaperone HemW [Syntrophorhabdaceae bacterium]|nr:radical SAM family heme chaperone HemW [Syntrophorhabdaceae bacterium]